MLGLFWDFLFVCLFGIFVVHFGVFVCFWKSSFPALFQLLPVEVVKWGDLSSIDGLPVITDLRLSEIGLFLLNSLLTVRTVASMKHV